MSIDFLLSSTAGTGRASHRPASAAHGQGGASGFASLLEQAATRNSRPALESESRQAVSQQPVSQQSISQQSAAPQPAGDTPHVQQVSDPLAVNPPQGMPALLALAVLNAADPDSDPAAAPILDAEPAVDAEQVLVAVAAAGEEPVSLAGLAEIQAEQEPDATTEHPPADASEPDAVTTEAPRPEAGAVIASAANPPPADGSLPSNAAGGTSSRTAATTPLDGAATAPPAPHDSTATAIRSTAAAAAITTDGTSGTQLSDSVDHTMAARPAGPVSQPVAATTSTPVAGSAPGAASLVLTAPVASPQWQQDLGRQVAGLSRLGEQRVSLHLNPAELGPLLVDLKVVEQQAQIQLFAASSLVRSAVEQAIPQLREALAEQGITLGEASVGEQRDGQQQTADDNRRDGDIDGGEDQLAAAAAPPVAPIGAIDGRVDLYV